MNDKISPYLYQTAITADPTYEHLHLKIDLFVVCGYHHSKAFVSEGNLQHYVNVTVAFRSFQ